MRRDCIYGLIILLLSSVSLHAGEITTVRGEIVWTGESETIIECASGNVYWVRVLVSAQYFRLSKRVEELHAQGEGTIIAELEGKIDMGVPSAGPHYPVDGTLHVSRILSVEHSSCGK